MINCLDNIYYIYYTDGSTGAIAIPKSTLDQTTLDISLIGKTRLEYGEVFNENILHLLENFCSPSNTNTSPDSTETYLELLENPVVGQLWYNSQTENTNICVSADPIAWQEIQDISNVSGNSGILTDGEYIPLPVSPTGYEFAESECVWHVSPYFTQTYAQEVTGLTLTADNRLVYCKFNTATEEYYGLVNYIIIGIKNTTAPEPTAIECETPELTATPPEEM